MALTNTEASAVNTLLEWLLDQPRPHHYPTRVAAAKEAAELLADHASKTLMAGLRGQDVLDCWPRPNEAGEYVFTPERKLG